MAKKLAIVDGNALCHIVKHATKNLSFNGSNTGVLYGLIRKIFNIQEKIFAHKWVWTWDVPTNELFRKQAYPAYKENRTTQKEAEKKLNDIAVPQFAIARNFMLPTIGFNNHFISKGLEADDIIAKLCEQFAGEYEIIIISRDGDLYQLLFEGVISMYDPSKFGYITQKAFESKWGVPPSKWASIKAIAGCGGDNVIGVKGVAEKTAIQYLKGNLKQESKKAKDIQANEDMIINNLRLVLLPWENTPEFTIVEDSLSEKGFIDACMEYGFNSYLKEGLSGKFNQLFIQNQ